MSELYRQCDTSPLPHRYKLQQCLQRINQKHLLTDQQIDTTYYLLIIRTMNVQ